MYDVQKAYDDVLHRQIGFAQFSKQPLALAQSDMRWNCDEYEIGPFRVRQNLLDKINATF